MRCLNDYRGNCCAVALHEISGHSEHDVVSACLRRSPGFWRGKGMFRNEWLAAGRDLGLTLEKVNCWNDDSTLPTLKQWTKRNARGTFLVRVRRHLLVVRDGAIIDPNWNGHTGSRRRVHEVYRVANPAASRNHANTYNTRAAARRRDPQPFAFVAKAPSSVVTAPTKRAPGKRYDANPTFRFRKTPTTARALAAFNALAIKTNSTDGWITLSDAERYGYTRKDFRNDARKERIEIR